MEELKKLLHSKIMEIDESVVKEVMTKFEDLSRFLTEEEKSILLRTNIYAHGEILVGRFLLNLTWFSMRRFLKHRLKQINVWKVDSFLRI